MAKYNYTPLEFRCPHGANKSECPTCVKALEFSRTKSTSITASTISTSKSESNFSSFLSSISTDFHLSQTQISYLESYYLLHWSASWLLKQAKNDLTTIEHSDTIYLLNWQNLDPSLIYGQIRISFRKPFCSSFGFAIIEQIDL